MNSTRIWMKLMGYHNFYTGKDSNNCLISKDNGERFADKRTHQHSTDIACQWVDCGYIPKKYTRNVPFFLLSKRKIPTTAYAYVCSSGRGRWYRKALPNKSAWS